eukprot:10407039-Prorocentrum_lima.AAC.1
MPEMILRQLRPRFRTIEKTGHDQGMDQGETSRNSETRIPKARPRSENLFTGRGSPEEDFPHKSGRVI